MTGPTRGEVGVTERRAALDLLFEAVPGDMRAGVRGRGMPARLEQRYGTELLIPLRPDRPTVVANFVSTLDGIVALGGGDLSGGGLISGFHEPEGIVIAITPHRG